jgi:hypothetical protein
LPFQKLCQRRKQSEAAKSIYLSVLEVSISGNFARSRSYAH